MPTTYTRKRDGKTVTYADKRTPEEKGGGPGPNLTLRVPEDMFEDLAAVAAAMGMKRSRGNKAGEGSISQLVTAIGSAAQHYGIAATARRLKRIVK